MNCKWRLKTPKKKKKEREINGGRRESIRGIGEGDSLFKRRSISGKKYAWLWFWGLFGTTDI